MTRPFGAIGRVDVSVLASGMPCGTSTAPKVSGAPATPVPTVKGTLADPWSADSASPRLTACPQGSELSSWTPKGVVFAAVPENCSDG